MVRNYVHKTNRAENSEQNIAAALNDYKNGNFTSLRDAATAYGLKKSTLHYRLQKIKEKDEEADQNQDVDRPIPDNLNPNANNEEPQETEERNLGLDLITTNDMAPIYHTKYSQRQVFTADQENMIVEYIIERSQMNYGLTYAQTKELAYKYACALNLNERMPKTWVTNESAGEEWLYNFMKRHPNLSLRQAENTSLSRNTSFNAYNVNLFYDNLERLYAKVNVSPSRILNFDECGISTVLEAPKVIAAKGTRQVGQVVSGERGELVTCCAIICADGSYLLPVLIYPRKRPNPAYMVSAPVGSKDFYSGSGWMNEELFLETLKHIQKEKGSSKTNPLILVLDNHDSHISLDAVMYCRTNGIHLITFHPHTTHRMQPLDITVFGPFKKRLRTEFNLWLAKNPGCSITIREIAMLSNEPLKQSFTESNIKSGFRKSGIHPFDRSIFKEVDFKGSSVTDRPMPQQIEEGDRTVDHSSPLNIPSSLNDRPTTSRDCSLSFNISEKDHADPSSLDANGSSTHQPVTPPRCTGVKNTYVNAPNQVISPKDVLPYPKYIPVAKKAGGRKKGRSFIATDTPEKNALERDKEEREAKRIRLEEKKQERAEKQKTKNVKRDCHAKKIYRELSSSSEDEGEPKYEDGGSSPEEFSESEELPFLSDRKFNNMDFVLTTLRTKKNIYHFIAQVEKTSSDGCTVKFLKKKDNGYRFYFSEKVDISFVEAEDVLFKLSQPDIIGGTSRAANCFIFKEDLTDFNLK